ncbi:MAG: DUF362 domain-containing protein [Actinomycetota bacterium]|nr:DUF362 domain-containing protein [Actinomycetota bacterium]
MTEDLFDRAGFADLIEEGDLVAIKVHFGERGNTAFVPAIYLRRIVDKVKAAGGKPFLTDAGTLYKGSRSNAPDHLVTAIENGFAFSVAGAPLIIADGLNGKDYFPVEVGGKHFDKVKIASAAHLADALIAVSHFKGHEMTGFGGAIKNVGMGLGSRSAKQEMHSDAKPAVDESKCIGCKKCTKWCPVNAISMTSKNKVLINEGICIGCGECTVTCPFSAIAVNWQTSPGVIAEKICEYVKGALKGKETKSGFFNFVMNVTPDCDCWSWSDAPIAQDIGILASKDIVAIDQASADLVNESAGRDLFASLHPHTDGSVQLEYGQKIGLGSRTFRLI